MKFLMRFVSSFAAASVLAGFASLTAYSQAAKPKPTPAKAKPVDTKPAQKKPVTPSSPKSDEKSEWEKVSAITDSTERIKAIKKFLSAFPASERKAEAHTLWSATAAELGAASMSAGDLTAAAANFKIAVKEAPTPVPEQLFNDVLSKVPVNLFFRGARTEAFEIAALLEKKASANVPQLLAIATFYMSVENGAEAKRVAEIAIKLDPTSSAAYQSLGLANRIDFQLDESTAAYEKALELDPESISARRGLAEMKRSMGKADDAVALYREILVRDAANLPAETGLVLSLFDSGKTSDAEAELAKALDANSGNVILLAGSAYWYAAHGDGQKAINYAQKAIAADPRFIWSHIALARGYLKQNDWVAAEKTLLAARRYGNFPTLEYEIASARMAAGYYREAAEEFAKSFSVKDGLVHTKLGGRIQRESKDLTELIGFERRASIFAPVAADSPENAARMVALLEIKQELAAAEPNSEVLARASDEFVQGDDKMKVHRQIFAAEQLLEKKAALPKVLELTKSAISNVDAGLEVPNPSIAVMASQLYENRALAATRGDYINVPSVPRQTLSAILRGQIEEISGWALYHSDAPEDAVVRLKRAVSVLPPESAWWRSSTWRLGSALARTGKDAEALDFYIRSYKGGTPNAFSYGVIENLYTKVNGNTVGLDARIGVKPGSAVSNETVARNMEPSPTARPVPTPEVKAAPTFATRTESIPAVVPVESPRSIETPAVSPTPISRVAPTIEPKVESTPAAVPVESPKPTETPEAKPSAVVDEPKPTPAASPTPAADEPKAVATPIATPEPTPSPVETPVATPSPTPAVIVEEPKPTPEPSPTPVETPMATPKPPPTVIVEELKPTLEVAKAVASPKPTPKTAVRSAAKKPFAGNPKGGPTDKTVASLTNELFPPVVIKVPSPTTVALSSKSPEASPSPESTPAESVPKPTPEDVPQSEAKSGEQSSRPNSAAKKPVTDTRPSDGRLRVVTTESAALRPCTLSVSEEVISLQSGGSDLAVIVGRDDDEELLGLSAVSTSPGNVAVRRENIAGVRARALFVLKAVGKAGVYQVYFRLPCGRKEIVVKVL